MARLACKLIDDFSQNSSVDALVFDNGQAARNLAVGFPEQTNYGEYLWHLRARFQWNVNAKEGEMRYVIPNLRDKFGGWRGTTLAPMPRGLYRFTRFPWAEAHGE